MSSVFEASEKLQQIAGFRPGDRVGAAILRAAARVGLGQGRRLDPGRAKKLWYAEAKPSVEEIDAIRLAAARFSDGARPTSPRQAAHAETMDAADLAVEVEASVLFEIRLIRARLDQIEALARGPAPGRADPDRGRAGV